MAERSLACTRQKEVIVDNRFKCEHSTDTDSKDVFTGEFSLSMCYFHPGRETGSEKGCRREELNEQEKLTARVEKDGSRHFQARKRERVTMERTLR